MVKKILKKAQKEAEIHAEEDKKKRESVDARNLALENTQFIKLKKCQTV